MPEKGEVQVIADQLQDLILGKTLINLKYDLNSRYNKEELQGFSELKFPYLCKEIKTKGKKIIITLEKLEESKDESKKVYLLSFLGMSGKWIPADNKSKEEEKGKHSNLWLEFGTYRRNRLGKGPSIRSCNLRLYFDDPRHFGALRIFHKESEMTKFLNKTTGPDLLTDDISPEEWQKKLKNFPQKEICLFLLDQKQFSGIGAYLRAEILYSCGISPFRKIKDLSDDEISNLLKVSKEKIKESYDAKGLTIRDYLAPDGSRGEFKQIIYGKEEDPLGNPVVKDKDSKSKSARTIHWVPAVQK